MFVGYADDSRSYRVYDTDSGQIYNRRYADVKFDEREKTTEGKDQQSQLVDDVLAQLEMQLTQREEGEHGEVHPGFMRTERDHTVGALAKLFNMTAEEYLSHMHMYDGWYQRLTSADSKGNS